jgi:hypothetical protein
LGASPRPPFLATEMEKRTLAGGRGLVARTMLQGYRPTPRVRA